MSKSDLRKPTKNDIEQFLAIVDANKDSQISLAEFKKWYNAKLREVLIRTADETIQTLSESLDVAAENINAAQKSDKVKKKCIVM